MLHMKKSLSKMAVLALTVSMLAAGCSDAGKEPANNAAGNETAVTEQPTAPPATEAPTDVPTEAPTETEVPTATEKPAADKETAAPVETKKPAATEKPKNEGVTKPAPTAKPTAKPPVTKPAATAKPTQKPAEKPKPTQKPSATPKPSQKPAADFKVSDITTKITTDIEYSMLGNVEGEQLKDVFGTDFKGLVSEGVYLQAMMNVKATELSIVKLTSDKSYDAVAEAFETRAAYVQKSFETYLQDQYEDAKNYKIVRNGDYVMFSISHDQDAVVKIFNSFFK